MVDQNHWLLQRHLMVWRLYSPWGNRQISTHISSFASAEVKQKSLVKRQTIKRPLLSHHTALVLSFTGDIYASEGDEESEWVATERQQFLEFWDKNHDGKMDKEETLDWILTSYYNHAETEAKHLLQESDADQVRLCSATASHSSQSVYLFHTWGLYLPRFNSLMVFIMFSNW